MLNVPRLLLACRIFESLELVFVSFLFLSNKARLSLSFWKNKLETELCWCQKYEAAHFQIEKTSKTTHAHDNTRHFFLLIVESRANILGVQVSEHGGVVSRQKCSGPLRERQTGRLINDWQSLASAGTPRPATTKVGNPAKESWEGGFLYFFISLFPLGSISLSLSAFWLVYAICSVGPEELNALVTWRNKAETRDPSVQ